MAALDDITLIKKFVDGEDILLANPNLRVEPAFNTAQLLAKTGELIATLKLVSKIRTALVRRESKYWDLVHQALQTNSFIPMSQVENLGFMQYEQHEIPAGYKLNYTEAKFLWKDWWLSRYKNHSPHLQLDLLIFQRNTWYAIRDIICSEGTLFIKTWIAEVPLHICDRVVWLSKSQQH